jgi:hypothetical protein
MQTENAEQIDGSDVAEPVAVVEPTETPEASPDQPKEGSDEGAQETKRHGAQQRINEITRQKYEAQREAEYWKAKAEELKTAPAAPATEKPVVSDFDDYESFVEALADWKAEQKVSEVLTKREQEQKQREAETQAKTAWEERVEKVREELPDYDEVIFSDAFRTLPVSAAMAEAIEASEFGPKLAYHLAKNPAEAARIASLAPIPAVRELLMLEGKLSVASPPQTRPVSAAPAPIAPVAGARAAVSKDPATMTDAEFAAWRRGQISRRR